MGLQLLLFDGTLHFGVPLFTGRQGASTHLPVRAFQKVDERSISNSFTTVPIRPQHRDVCKRNAKLLYAATAYSYM